MLSIKEIKELLWCLDSLSDYDAKSGCESDIGDDELQKIVKKKLLEVNILDEEDICIGYGYVMEYLRVRLKEEINEISRLPTNI